MVRPGLCAGFFSRLAPEKALPRRHWSRKMPLGNAGMGGGEENRAVVRGVSRRPLTVECFSSLGEFSSVENFGDSENCRCLVALTVSGIHKCALV